MRKKRSFWVSLLNYVQKFINLLLIYFCEKIKATLLEKF